MTVILHCDDGLYFEQHQFIFGYFLGLEKVGESWRKLEKVGESWRKLEKGESWRKEKVGERRKLEKGESWRKEKVGERRKLEKGESWRKLEVYVFQAVQLLLSVLLTLGRFVKLIKGVMILSPLGCMDIRVVGL